LLLLLLVLVLHMLGRIAVGGGVGIGYPCYPWVRSLCSVRLCLPIFCPTTYSGGRRMRPGPPGSSGHSHVRTLAGRHPAASRTAGGRTRLRVRGGRRQPSAWSIRLGRRCPSRLLAHHRLWDQCPKLCRHGSVVRRTWGLVSNRVGTTSGHPLGNVLLDVVHLGDGFLRLLLVGVSHKPEAPAAASVAVLDNNLASC
jgi:hypothetical protein